MALVRQIPCKNCVLSVLSTLDSVRRGTSWACWAFSGVMSSRAWFVHTARNRMSSQTSSPPLSQWIGKMGNPFKQGCSYICNIYIYLYIHLIQTYSNQTWEPNADPTGVPKPEGLQESIRTTFFCLVKLRREVAMANRHYILRMTGPSLDYSCWAHLILLILSGHYQSGGMNASLPANAEDKSGVQHT